MDYHASLSVVYDTGYSVKRGNRRGLSDGTPVPAVSFYGLCMPVHSV